MMVPGEKRLFWIPPALAHGNPPRKAGYPPGMTVYEIELISISEPGEQGEVD
jgi:FKBP-type peptidyl-prolyl cis-trans isomerase